MGLLAAVVAVGTAAAITYNTFLSSDSGLPEVLTPLQPIAKDDDGEVKQKTDIAFSPEESFFSEDITVELTAKDKNARIYYTTDGSTPTEKSSAYSSPIKVRSGKDVTAKTIKAIAVSEDGTSEVFTKSYVTGDDVAERFEDGTYVFVLSTDDVNLYDYEKGIAVAGKIRDDWIANEYDGKSEITPNDPANWNQEGMDGERPMYVEAFSSSGELLVSQQAGARVAGAYSAAVDQKSWKLIARTMYTPDKGKFGYPFFSDATDESGAILTKIDRIVLRNGANVNLQVCVTSFRCRLRSSQATLMRSRPPLRQYSSTESITVLHGSIRISAVHILKNATAVRRTTIRWSEKPRAR